MGGDVSRSDPLAHLREAVERSPENTNLRRHYATSLLQAERGPQAEREFRAVLRSDPADVDASLGLAEAFLLQGDYSAAAVVVEPLLSGSRRAEAHLLLARVEADRGQTDAAYEAYRVAVDGRPDLADRGLAERVGFVSFRESDPFDFDAEDGLGDLFGEESGESMPTEAGDPPERLRSTIRFADVIGHEEIIARLRLRVATGEHGNSPVATVHRNRMSRATLLIGPPGCGKTMLGHAMAGEREGGILSLSLGDAARGWPGERTEPLRRLFEIARTERPAIVLIDDLDAVVGAREQARSTYDREAVVQFLGELDQLHRANEDLFVLAATSRPWALDRGLFRSGRLGDMMLVGLPGHADRVRVCQTMLEGVPTEAIDLNAVCDRFKGFTVAEVQAVVRSAIERAALDAVASQKTVPIDEGHLRSAAATVRPAAADWFASPMHPEDAPYQHLLSTEPARAGTPSRPGRRRFCPTDL